MAACMTTNMEDNSRGGEHDLEVLCIGMMVADIIVRPVESFQFSVDTTQVDELCITSGGDALNTAIDLARLGINAAILGKVGNDYFGRFLTDSATAAGVVTDAVRVGEGEATSSTIVLVKVTGERAFIYHPGSNATLCPEDVDPAVMEHARIVHIGSVYALPALEGQGMAGILRRARELGKITTLDVTWPNHDRWLETLEPCLPHLDFFMPSMNEAIHITGRDTPEEIAAFLLDRGVGTVVLKRGANGCYVRTAGQEHHVPPSIPARVVDTTGAGDAFVAGFLAGLSKGWPLRKCAQLANAVGALAVQEMGSTTGVTNIKDAIRLMSD